MSLPVMNSHEVAVFFALLQSATAVLNAPDQRPRFAVTIAVLPLREATGGPPEPCAFNVFSNLNSTEDRLQMLKSITMGLETMLSQSIESTIPVGRPN